MGPPEVKGRGECPKIRKRSKGCVEWYTICAYGSGVQVTTNTPSNHGGHQSNALTGLMATFSDHADPSLIPLTLHN